MMKFFTMFIFLVQASFCSFAQDEIFTNAVEEIQANLENAKQNIIFYSESMNLSQASYEKYYYWRGRLHSYEECLYLIQNYQIKD